MSSRTKAAVLAAAFTLASASAHAAVECPATSQGHAFARWGGTLFQGDPSNEMSLAPTAENPGGKGVNFWKTPDPVGIVLVCRYVGLSTPLTFNLTADVRACAQSVTSFTCK